MNKTYVEKFSDDMLTETLRQAREVIHNQSALFTRSVDQAFLWLGIYGSIAGALVGFELLPMWNRVIMVVACVTSCALLYRNAVHSAFFLAHISPKTLLHDYFSVKPMADQLRAFKVSEVLSMQQRIEENSTEITKRQKRTTQALQSFAAGVGVNVVLAVLWWLGGMLL